MNLWLIAGHFGYALAAILCASLAIHISRRSETVPQAQWLIVALALTALWALRHSFVGFTMVGQRWDGLTETLRNAAWLAVLAVHLRAGAAADGAGRHRMPVIVALGIVLLIQLALDLMVAEGTLISARLLPFFEANWMLRCAFSLGALFVVHGWSKRGDSPANMRREMWVGAALACMWAYDFNHYMLAWLTEGRTTPIVPMRGAVMALLMATLALGLRSDGTRDFALSRALLSRVAPFAVIGLYVAVIILMAGIATEISAPLGRVVQFSLLFALAVAVLAILPSASIRSWLWVALSRNVFAHRYDYRTMWLRFATTMGASGEDAPPLDARIVRALAEAIASPSAALYLFDGNGVLKKACAHDWPGDIFAPASLPPALTETLAPSGWIIDIAANWSQISPLLSSDAPHFRKLWAIAPLIHAERLIGAVLLSRPPARKGVDWEDEDVLRVVCAEAAARISEERNRAALVEAQRFDEFNRRFAFIFHDLKNLVSQMSLLASNARRHAENPAFREDMILTLEETAVRSSDLLQRLNRPGTSGRSEPAGLLIGPWIHDRARTWSAGLGTVEVEGQISRPIRANIDGLNRALGHLVRNGLEASPKGEAVTLRLDEEATGAAIHVIDKGRGMSRAFMDHDLYRPFSSTKASGFGLGAHEARLLIEGMGGALLVESDEGRGSCFTVRLPFAQALENTPDRKDERSERKAS